MTAEGDPRLDAAARLYGAGDLDGAEAGYQAIVADDPAHAEAHKFLALICLTQGDFDAAIEHIEMSVTSAPAVGEYWHLSGRIRMEVGDLDRAAEDLGRSVGQTPMDPVGAHLDLALCHARRGDWSGSLSTAEMLLRMHPENPFALRAAATASLSLGQADQAEAFYKRAVASDSSDAGGWEGLARLARQRGDTPTALELLDKAVALEPDNADYAYLRRVVAAETVPAWHFNMMNDTARNSAFAAAIRRKVRADHLVLEIGTGAGLLALMAASAGARVVTCEANPAIAAIACEIIARNGLADRVTVINKPSWQLAVGVDLPRPADVLIAEIFSAQLISEDVLPSLEDAKRRLCAPDAIVIPAVGVMRGALVQSPSLEALTRIGTVEGFDLSPFNAFTPPLMNLEAPNLVLGWLSEPVDLFGFDFQGDDRWPEGINYVDVEVSASGRCQGVVQWLWLAVDETIPYENPPLGAEGTRTPHWTPLLYTFPRPVDVEKGQVMRLRVLHDRKGARIDIAPAGQD